MTQVPTEAEAYQRLMEWVRRAQEESANLSHLTGLNGHTNKSRDWLIVSENFKKIGHVVTQIATSGLH